MEINKYEKHAVPFFMRTYRDFKIHDIVTVELDALEYIITQSDFREKDILDASILTDEVEKRNFIKFIERKNNVRYFKITHEGISAIHR